MTGKEKCECLKAIRESIAEMNGIVYIPKECNHEDCSFGICPLCENEAEMLMDELHKKEAAGSPIRIDTESLYLLEMLSKENTQDEPDSFTMGIPAPLEGEISSEFDSDENKGLE